MVKNTGKKKGKKKAQPHEPEPEPDMQDPDEMDDDNLYYQEQQMQRPRSSVMDLIQKGNSLVGWRGDFMNLQARLQAVHNIVT